MNPIAVAVKGKGLLNFTHRSARIVHRYGLTPNKLDRAIAQLVAVLHQFECKATLPITAIVLQRNPRVAARYQAAGIEFAIHGYYHVDHYQLSPAEQLAQLELARQTFARAHIQAQGYRSPYLRSGRPTLAALQQEHFLYDSSQAIAWAVPDGSETPAYRNAIDFYGALPARDYPSLPNLQGNLVRIPYSLPDDEALTERLTLASPDMKSMIWRDILQRTYELGELFTLGLHPERIDLCQRALIDTLTAARRCMPPIWIARLDEVASWWRVRAAASVQVAEAGNDQFQIIVNGPPGTTVLARGIQVTAPAVPWADGYRRVDAYSFTALAEKRPTIGVAPCSSLKLVSFLRQQGYVVETAIDAGSYAVYLDQVDLAERDERPLLDRLDKVSPLIRLGRWPRGTRSAFAITGDIDALTLHDYVLRFLGR
jgi:peptidoglycan/xylan/chitin deacetylase (PgdA/CDA1 family)